MEWVEGTTLDRAGLPLEDVLRVMAQVARGVEAAHRLGIVHRDLKPSNILVSARGEGLVADFGLARPVETPDALTLSGAVMGTPSYMAPEQARGEIDRIDARTDVWGLGATLYDLTTGRPPFEGASYVEIIQRAATGEVTPPHLRDPRLPVEVELIVQKALRPEMERRYQTAEALADDLERYLRGDPIDAKPSRLTYRVFKHIKKRRWPYAAAAGGVLAVAATIAVLMPMLTRRERELTKAQEALLENMRKTTGAYLDVALESRRQGRLDRMQAFGEQVETICADVQREMPWLAEPHYRLGRMYRALMRFDRALEEQERALAKEPGYRDSLYERGLLRLRRYEDELERAKRNWWMNVRASGQVQTPTREELERREPGLAEFRESALADLRASAGPAARGLVAYLEGDETEAKRFLLEAHEKDSPLEEPYEWLGRLSPDFQEKLNWATKGIDVDRGYLPYWWERIELRRKEADRAHLEARVEGPEKLYEAALADCADALELDGSLDRTWVARGMVLTNRGLYSELRGGDPAEIYASAISDFGEALKINPSDGQTWMNRGAARASWAAFRQRRGRDPQALHAGAESDYLEALKLDAGIADAWFLLGDLRMNLGLYHVQRGESPEVLYAEALEDFSRAIERSPFRHEFWTSRASGRMNLGVFRKNRNNDPVEFYAAAIEDVDKAIEINPRSADAWMVRASALVNWGLYKQGTGDDPEALYEEAVAGYEQALTLNPGHAETWAKRGAMRVNWGVYLQLHKRDPGEHHAAAIADFSKALDLDPAWHESWMGRGAARSNWGSFKQAVGLDPSDLFTGAIDDYTEAERLNPEGAGAIWRRGLCRSNMGDWEERLKRSGRAHWEAAHADFERAAELNPAERPLFEADWARVRRALRRDADF